MAGLYMYASGNWTIQLNEIEGKRPKIGLGKRPRRKATEICGHVETIVAAKLAGYTVNDDTARWLGALAEQEPKLYAKLASHGLVKPREAAASTRLADWIDACIAARTDVKPATKEVWRQGKKGLIDFFGADRDLASITPGDADG